jgi:hypothetical protein
MVPRLVITYVFETKRQCYVIEISRILYREDTGGYMRSTQESAICPGNAALSGWVPRDFQRNHATCDLWLVTLLRIQVWHRWPCTGGIGDWENTTFYFHVWIHHPANNCCNSWSIQSRRLRSRWREGPLWITVWVQQSRVCVHSLSIPPCPFYFR